MWHGAGAKRRAAKRPPKPLTGILASDPSSLAVRQLHGTWNRCGVEFCKRGAVERKQPRRRWRASGSPAEPKPTDDRRSPRLQAAIGSPRVYYSVFMGLNESRREDEMTSRLGTTLKGGGVFNKDELGCSMQALPNGGNQPPAADTTRGATRGRVGIIRET